MAATRPCIACSSKRALDAGTVPVESLAKKIWYGSHRAAILLLPLAWLFQGVVAIRTALYRRRWLRSRRLKVPTVIVGNLTVGGTGKTPLTIWLSQRLRREGFVPGILSRGYRGTSSEWPQPVTLNSDPALVGDEALVLARRSGCKVAVGPDRVAAAQLLIKEGVNIVICDDGLQHLRLARDFEILVVDGELGFGNGHCLPAGPLREPITRAAQVDVVVQNGGSVQFKVPGEAPCLTMRLRQLVAVPMAGGTNRRLADFAGSPVHAVAGIGNPERFFRQLESLGLEVIRHPMPDHAALTMDDILFTDHYPVLMTEKDAVKCTEFADQRHFFVPVTAELREADAQLLIDALRQALAATSGRSQGIGRTKS